MQHTMRAALWRAHRELTAKLLAALHRSLHWAATTLSKTMPSLRWRFGCVALLRFRTGKMQI